MPDMQNENKIMAMLERKGIIRKIGAEDELDEAEPVSGRSLPETDLQSLLGAKADDSPKVTPAARQPVPGMAKPVFPPTEAASPEQEMPKPVERVIPIEHIVAAEKPQVADTPAFVGVDPFKEDSIKTEEPVATPEQRATLEKAAQLQQQLEQREQLPPMPQPLQPLQPLQPPPPPPPPPAPPPENYTERYLEIDDLYEALSLKAKKTDTIYLIEDYLKTLPDSLPDESRREIISKIVAASGFDYDLLMGDGVLRVKMLKEYAERFARHTDDYISARHAELDELDQQTMRIRRMIENRRELHKKQFFSIEAEAQRLKEILTFISG